MYISTISICRNVGYGMRPLSKPTLGLCGIDRNLDGIGYKEIGGS